MSGFLLLALCPLLGYFSARRGWMPQGAPAVFNAWLIKIALPALILDQIPRLRFDPTLLFPAMAPWVLFVATALLMPWLGRRLGWSRSAIGAMLLTCGLGNTSFVGLPLVLALAGPEALGPAVIADQVGTFIMMAVGGFWCAALFSGQRVAPRELARRVVASPPFVALLLGAAVWGLGGWPEPIPAVLHRLGDTITPIALFSVGLQFRAGAIGEYRVQLAVGLSWKLLAAPLLAWLAAWTLGLQGLPSMIGILQIAMAPMITAGIIAQDHNLEPRLANLIVSLGIAMSFVTVPLWYLLLR